MQENIHIRMLFKEITNVVTLINNDKSIRNSVVIITVLTCILGVILSPLTALMIYLSYILGFIICWFVSKYQNITSNYLQSFTNYYYSNHTSINRQLKYSCSICDDLSCQRHQQNKCVTPWKNLLIDKELNSVLTDFYNKIFNNFILSWYNQFTDDIDFVNELRYCMRFANANIINRLLEIDHYKLISNKLLPCIIKHVDDYIYMQQLSKLSNARLNSVIIDYLGKRLHFAVLNRRQELNYLQQLSELLIPLVLPEKYALCRNYSVLIREILAGWVFLPLMDAISDPNIYNLLIVYSANYKTKKNQKTKKNVENVEFLSGFIDTNTTRKSSFRTDLNAIKNNTELLYAFMQFLKKEESVYYLQFCLDVDEFNNKLLTPDLTKKQLEELHTEAIKIHREYFLKDSINFIDCPIQIIENYTNLINEGIFGIAKLRTSKPLYQAYEYVFNILENQWLPLFFHSNEFYNYICGSKVNANYNKTNRSSLLTNESPVKIRGRKYYESNQSTVSKISSGLVKIKGALKTGTPIDGSIYLPETPTIENGTMNEIIITDCANIFRDLSAWKVAILSYQISHKNVRFCIDVNRSDVVAENTKRHWIVLRRDQDFHTLKTKLIEFHGESEICHSPLPTRKINNSLETRMSKYEHFLQRLLQKPALRGSDLLYTFLTAEEDFRILITTIAPNVQDLGNIYQSVAHKLRKEKGQHLDAFMSTFLASTGKGNKGKFEWAETGDDLDVSQKNQLPSFPKTYRNYIFNDNFGITSDALKDTSCGSFNPSGIIECIFYLLKYIFNAPLYILRMYAAVCTLAQPAVEIFLAIFIRNKLKSSVNPSNLIPLIKLLEDIIFRPHIPPTKDELEIRKEKAFELINDFLPVYLDKIGCGNVKIGLKTILEILQHPQYNKQLMYSLLDIIIGEMYPSLNKTN